MIIRIVSKRHSSQEEKLWYWRMELERGDAVCISDNSHSMRGGYTTKGTAVRSAWRFIDRFLDRCCVEVMDGFTGESLGGRNLG